MTAGKRRTAREMAIQMLYQSDLGGSPMSHIFNTFDLGEYLAAEEREATKRAATPEARAEARDEQSRRRKRVEEAFRYARQLVEGTVEHRETIDELIRSQADNWRLERMPAVDRNILRLAVYEMLHERETP